MSDLQELFQKTEVQAFRQLLLQQQQAELLAKYDALNQSVRHPNVVFAGDSITEFYPVTELLQSSHYLYNRGIHGITSQHLLEHIDSQILDLQPNQLFLLIGVNDLKTRSPQKTAETIAEICQQVHEQCPDCKIYLLSVYPMNESPRHRHRPSGRNNAAIVTLNQLLKKIPHVHWLDLHAALCDDQGQLPATYTTDGLHLTVSGYRVVSQILQDYLK